MARKIAFDELAEQNLIKGFDNVIAKLKEVDKQADKTNEALNFSKGKTGKDYDENQKSIDSLKQLIAIQNQNIESQKKMNAEKEKSAKSLSEIRKSEKAYNEELKKSAIAQKEKIRQEKENEKQAKKLVAAIEKINKAEKKQQEALNRTIRSQKDLRENTNALIKKRDELNTTNRKGQKELARLTVIIKKNNAQLVKNDEQIDRHQRKVGKYQNALKGVGGTLAKMTGALGLTLGATQLLSSGIRDASRIVIDFQSSTATLAGVLNKDVSEIQALTDDAIRLGSVTAKTSTEVVKLQEAYARLGFSQSEILQLTEPTINGSIALGGALDETASLTGALVKTFDDFDAGDTPKILDQLTAATQNTALDFQKLQTGLPIVAGAANSAGIPFTRLVALLGKLSDAGIDTSSSATALRNIFIDSSAQGLNYEEILTKIVSSQDQLTAANDEFGKKTAVSSAILSKNIQETAELDIVLQNATGTAEKFAATKLDTLEGSLQLLNSAWEGLVLSIESGDGKIGSSLTRIIQYFTGLLGSLQPIGETLSAFGSLISELSANVTELATRMGLMSSETDAVSVTVDVLNFALQTVLLQFRVMLNVYNLLISAGIKLQNGFLFLAEKMGIMDGHVVGLIKNGNFFSEMIKAWGTYIKQTTSEIKLFGTSLFDIIQKFTLYDELFGKSTEKQKESLNLLEKLKNATHELNITKQETNNNTKKINSETKAIEKQTEAIKELKFASSKTGMNDLAEKGDFDGDLRNLLKFKDAADDISKAVDVPETSFLTKAFGSKNEIMSLGSSVKQFSDELIAGIQEQKDAQLEAVNSEIEMNLSRIDQLQANLDSQIELGEQGEANNADLIQEEIDEEEAKYEALQEEREKALEEKEKADKLARISDGLTQASSLITAAAKLFAAEAGKGLVGIGLAAGGLALLFSLFSAFKGKVGKFKDGVIDLQGAGTTTSDSIPAMLSKGETVTSADKTMKAKNLLLGIHNGLIDDSSLLESNTVITGSDNKKIEQLLEVNNNQNAQLLSPKQNYYNVTYK